MAVSLVDVTFPQSQDLVATSQHVEILRPVERHPASLPRAWLGESCWVSVPVVAIKLDHESDAWGEGVYAKFAADQVLRDVFNADLVEDRVAGALKVVWAKLGLHDVHADEMSASLRICVPAGRGAVCRRAGSLARRRPAERCAARLACVFVFVSALPNIGTCAGAKSSRDGASAADVEVGAALLASPTFAVHAPRPRGRSVAFERTVRRGRTQPLGHCRAATAAYDGSDGIEGAFHSANYSGNAPSVKAMRLTSYPISSRLQHVRGADEGLFAEPKPQTVDLFAESTP